MWSGPIGRRLYSGSSVWPVCPSTSMIGTSLGGAAVAAPGPSFLISSLIWLHRLRNAVGANEAEMHVHEKHDQRRQHEDVKSEEPLQRRRTHHRAALQQFLD